MTRVLLIAALIISCGCASKATYRTVQAGFVTTQALDWHSTHQALEAGAIESNPLVPSGDVGRFITKAIVSVVVLWLTERLSRTHRAVAVAVLSGLSGFYAIISAHNYRLATTQP